MTTIARKFESEKLSKNGKNEESRLHSVVVVLYLFIFCCYENKFHEMLNLRMKGKLKVETAAREREKMRLLRVNC